GVVHRKDVGAPGAGDRAEQVGSRSGRATKGADPDLRGARRLAGDPRWSLGGATGCPGPSDRDRRCARTASDSRRVRRLAGNRGSRSGASNPLPAGAGIPGNVMLTNLVLGLISIDNHTSPACTPPRTAAL